VAEDALGVVGARLVEAVHVELADEAVDLVVAEVAGEDELLEAVDVLDDELLARGCPEGDLAELLILC
jgi:triphosphoribosyl-dephospho-CoA synthetase